MSALDRDEKKAAAESGFHFTLGALHAIALCFLVGSLIVLALSYLFTPTDPTDQDWFNRSGVRIVTDKETGCQYLLSQHGGLTPRQGKCGGAP